MPVSPEPRANAYTRSVPSFGAVPPAFRHKDRLARLERHCRGAGELESLLDLLARPVDDSRGNVVDALELLRRIGEEGGDWDGDRRGVGMPGISRWVE